MVSSVQIFVVSIDSPFQKILPYAPRLCLSKEEKYHEDLSERLSRRRAIVIVNLEIQRSGYDLVNHGDSGPRGPCLSTILYCNRL